MEEGEIPPLEMVTIEVEEEESHATMSILPCLPEMKELKRLWKGPQH